jgi:phosphoglycolate phosphatase
MLTRPKAILFDWDNTLVDSWAVIHEALNHTMAAMGRPAWSIEDTKAGVRHSLRDSFPLHFGDDWKKASAIYLARFEAIHLARLVPLDGALRQLAWISDHGIMAGVVSNKTGRLVRLEVAKLGWERYFTRIIGAGDAAADKPDRAPIDLALDGSEFVAGPEVWYVGDTGIDVECALAAGCVPVLVHGIDTAAPHEAEVMAAAQFRFADFGEMERFLHDMPG